MPKKAKSKRQARFLGAVAGGQARDGEDLSAEKAKEMLRGTKMKELPEKVKKKKRKAKKKRAARK